MKIIPLPTPKTPPPPVLSYEDIFKEEGVYHAIGASHTDEFFLIVLHNEASKIQSALCFDNSAGNLFPPSKSYGWESFKYHKTDKKVKFGLV